jgi:NAD(P)-dependent dehydrogenase (short-subunit alcohol dehydrogenase family)
MINKGFRSLMFKLGGKLDSLVFCHGKFFSGKIKETSILLFDNALNINFRSYFHFMSLASPFLKITKGNVVFTANILGKIPQNNTFLNSLTNSMLNSLIENSALELAGFGVRVNAVAPFAVKTNFRVGLNNFTEQENFTFMNELEKFFIYGNEVLF